MMARVKMLLKSKKGDMNVLTIAIVIIMLMIILVASEFYKMIIISSGVKDAYEEAIISVVNDNYNEVYHCVREGYGGGYLPTGAGFYSAVDNGDVEGRLVSLLGLNPNGSAYAKFGESGTMEYQISEIRVQLHNTQIRVGGETFSADGVLKLEIPVRFNGTILHFMTVNLKVKAVLREKF